MDTNTCCLTLDMLLSFSELVLTCLGMACCTSLKGAYYVGLLLYYEGCKKSIILMNEFTWFFASFSLFPIEMDTESLYFFLFLYFYTCFLSVVTVFFMRMLVYIYFYGFL